MATRVKRERVDAFVRQCDGKLSIGEQARILGVSQTTITAARKRLGLVRKHTTPKAKRTEPWGKGAVRAFWLTSEAHEALRDWCSEQGLSMSHWLEAFIRREIMKQ